MASIAAWSHTSIVTLMQHSWNERSKMYFNKGIKGGLECLTYVYILLNFNDDTCVELNFN